MVLKEPSVTEVNIDYSKLKISTCRGSGPGGQNRNKLETTVHLQYGDIRIRIGNERSQHKNKALAMAILKAKIFEILQERKQSLVTKTRDEQIGSGKRGEKRRTISVINGKVKDHKSGKSTAIEVYKKGKIENLHCKNETDGD